MRSFGFKEKQKLRKQKAERESKNRNWESRKQKTGKQKAEIYFRVPNQLFHLHSSFLFSVSAFYFLNFCFCLTPTPVAP